MTEEIRFAAGDRVVVFAESAAHQRERRIKRFLRLNPRGLAIYEDTEGDYWVSSVLEHRGVTNATFCAGQRVRCTNPVNDRFGEILTIADDWTESPNPDGTAKGGVRCNETGNYKFMRSSLVVVGGTTSGSRMSPTVSRMWHERAAARTESRFSKFVKRVEGRE